MKTRAEGMHDTKLRQVVFFGQTLCYLLNINADF